MGSWLLNARENRLTPWNNDPLALEGSQTLTVSGPEGEDSAVLTAEVKD